MQSLRWLVALALKAGVLRILINGSFVAGAEEPNDVDCVLLLGARYPQDQAAAANELAEGLPFIQLYLQLYLVEQDEYDYFGGEFFATDRDNVRKGPLGDRAMALKNQQQLDNT